MRFIHIADVHLGYAPPKKGGWSETRADEIWSTFERLIKQIKENPVDMLLVAGDLFDRQPLLREVREVDYLFSTIKDTKVVLIAGNHDAMVPGSFYRDFKWSSNVVFLSSSNIQKKRIPELNVDVYGLSYSDYEIRESLYDNIIIEDKSAINILVGHGGERKCIPINRQKLMSLDFDYVAMGHFHNPDLNQEGRIAYCGSLEPTSVDDTGIRGYILGEVTKEGLDLEFVPFSKRNYKQFNLDIGTSTTIADIKSMVGNIVEANGTENIYKFIINGKRNPMLEIRFDDIKGLCNLAELVDKSIPDYNFEKIYEENKDNIIGMFIDRYIHSSIPLDEHRKKSLLYGTRALLEATEEK